MARRVRFCVSRATATRRVATSRWKACLLFRVAGHARVSTVRAGFWHSDCAHCLATVERPTKPGNAAVLAAAYAKLANECARARGFCAAKLESPMLDCAFRARAILARVNRLLESAYAPEIAASIVGLNNLAAETARRAGAARSPELITRRTR